MFQVLGCGKGRYGVNRRVVPPAGQTAIRNRKLEPGDVGEVCGFRRTGRLALALHARLTRNAREEQRPQPEPGRRRI